MRGCAVTLPQFEVASDDEANFDANKKGGRSGPGCALISHLSRYPPVRDIPGPPNSSTGGKLQAHQVEDWGRDARHTRGMTMIVT
jgi:hypothetical protein